MPLLNISQKTKAFEFLSQKFFDWYCDFNKVPAESVKDSFSKLKLIKLHFFACTVTSEERENDLLNEFNNFYAMPLGHVESDVYGAMSSMATLEFYRTSIDVKQVEVDYFDEISPELKQKLTESVELLKEKNPELINYEPMKLVELSHSWNSWTSVFSMARRMDKYSMKIPTDLIRNEYKTYCLN